MMLASDDASASQQQTQQSSIYTKFSSFLPAEGSTRKMDTPSSLAFSMAAASAGVEDEFILKVVLVGDASVGKTNLVSRFTRNLYSSTTEPTKGFEFSTKTIRVAERVIKIQVWDAAGLERYQALTEAYYRGAVAALVVYDITDRQSFEHVSQWLREIEQSAHKNIVRVLVGNKSDIVHLPRARKVSTLEAARFADKHDMQFLETSALDGSNVLEAFKKAIIPVSSVLLPHYDASEELSLPAGWRRVESRTRPGEYSYENQYTRERLAFIPSEAAKPSQLNFRAQVSTTPLAATVTREQLQRLQKQQMNAQLQRSSSLHPRQGCENYYCCTIL